MEPGTTLFIIWRTKDREHHIEALHPSLDDAREWIRAQLAERQGQPRGNWVCSFQQPERWSLQTTAGVWHIGPITVGGTLVKGDDQDEA